MALEKFCPKCGKKVEELIEGICYQCYSLNKELVEAPASLSIILCKCTRAKTKNEWRYFETFDQLMKTAVMENIKLDKDVTIDIDFPKKVPVGKTTIPVNIKATKKAKDMKIRQESRILVTITPQTCDQCGKQSGNYYEGIIQIRGNKDKWEELRNFVYSYVERRTGKDENSFITSEERLKEGININIGSIKQAYKILAEAQKQFDVETNATHKLVGAKDGKELKRVTILLRLK